MGERSAHGIQDVADDRVLLADRRGGGRRVHRCGLPRLCLRRLSRTGRGLRRSSRRGNSVRHGRTAPRAQGRHAYDGAGQPARPHACVRAFTYRALGASHTVGKPGDRDARYGCRCHRSGPQHRRHGKAYWRSCSDARQNRAASHAGEGVRRCLTGPAPATPTPRCGFVEEAGRRRWTPCRRRRGLRSRVTASQGGAAGLIPIPDRAAQGLGHDGDTRRGGRRAGGIGARQRAGGRGIARRRAGRRDEEGPGDGPEEGTS